MSLCLHTFYVWQTIGQFRFPPPTSTLPTRLINVAYILLPPKQQEKSKLPASHFQQIRSICSQDEKWHLAFKFFEIICMLFRVYRLMVVSLNVWGYYFSELHFYCIFVLDKIKEFQKQKKQYTCCCRSTVFLHPSKPHSSGYSVTSDDSTGLFTQRLLKTI